MSVYDEEEFLMPGGKQIQRTEQPARRGHSLPLGGWPEGLPGKGGGVQDGRVTKRADCVPCDSLPEFPPFYKP